MVYQEILASRNCILVQIICLLATFLQNRSIVTVYMYCIYLCDTVSMRIASVTGMTGALACIQRVSVSVITEVSSSLIREECTLKRGDLFIATLSREQFKCH